MKYEIRMGKRMKAETIYIHACMYNDICCACTSCQVGQYTAIHSKNGHCVSDLVHLQKQRGRCLFYFASVVYELLRYA